MGRIRYYNRGQTLVTLLFFMVIAITIVSAGVIAIMINFINTSRQTNSEDAYYLAESGIENALIRLLRDPSYPGETLSLDGGTAQITVTGTDPLTVTSVGEKGDYMRKLTVTTTFTNSILTVLTWKEANN